MRVLSEAEQAILKQMEDLYFCIEDNWQRVQNSSSQMYIENTKLIIEQKRAELTQLLKDHPILILENMKGLEDLPERVREFRRAMDTFEKLRNHDTLTSSQQILFPKQQEGSVEKPLILKSMI